MQSKSEYSHISTEPFQHFMYYVSNRILFSRSGRKAMKQRRWKEVRLLMWMFRMTDRSSVTCLESQLEHIAAAQYMWLWFGKPAEVHVIRARQVLNTLYSYLLLMYMSKTKLKQPKVQISIIYIHKYQGASSVVNIKQIQSC